MFYIKKAVQSDHNVLPLKAAAFASAGITRASFSQTLSFIHLMNKWIAQNPFSPCCPISSKDVMRGRKSWFRFLSDISSIKWVRHWTPMRHCKQNYFIAYIYRDVLLPYYQINPYSQTCLLPLCVHIYLCIPSEHLTDTLYTLNNYTVICVL